MNALVDYKPDLEPEFWRYYAQLADEAGKASPFMKEIIQKTGMSRNTIYTRLKEIGGWKSGNKTRCDADVKINTVYREFLEIVSAIWNQKIKVEEFDRTNMPLALATHLAKKYKPWPQEILDLSDSHIGLMLRKLKISKTEAKKQPSFIKLKSLYSNHVHQMDTSICRYYIDPKQFKIIRTTSGSNYKNKPIQWDKRKIPLIRWILVDHLSGAFFVYYSLGNNQLDVAEFLYLAWKKKDDLSLFPFHGLPCKLILDNDKAMRSHAMLRLYKYLEIEIPNVKPHRPRVKGTVEQLMKWWEIWFESRFLLNQPADLEEINRKAYQCAIELQSTRIHSRHKMTRFAKWDQAINLEKFRECPPYKIYQTCLHGKPKVCIVNGDGSFRFNGKKYYLEGISRTKVDVIVHPFKYAMDFSVTVQYPSRSQNKRNYLAEEIQTYVVQPIPDNMDGFNNAIEWGEYGKAPDTLRERNLKIVDQTAEKLDNEKFDPFEFEQPAAHFIPKNGKPVIPVSEFTFKEKELTKEDLLYDLAERLARPLRHEEITHINELEGDKFNEDVFESLLKQFRNAPVTGIAGGAA